MASVKNSFAGRPRRSRSSVQVVYEADELAITTRSTHPSTLVDWFAPSSLPINVMNIHERLVEFQRLCQLGDEQRVCDKINIALC
jgi:hypothetical protein